MVDRVTGELPRTILIGWALGPLGATLVYTPYTFLLLRFMTDYLAVPALVGGAMLGSAKIVDAGSDILVGWLSDRTRSRWGRRRPYLLVGGTLNAIALVPLFWVPAALSGTATIAYLMAAIWLFSVGSALWYVPYIAMTAEMTTSHHGRSVLVSYRVSGSAVGQLIGGAGAAWLVVGFGADRAAHGAMAVTLAAAAFALFTASLLLTRHAPTTERHHGSPLSLGEQIRTAAANRPFVLLLAMKVLYFIGLAANLVSNSYFVKYNQGLSERWLGTFLLVGVGATLASLPVWIRLARQHERRTLIVAALLGQAAVYLSWLAAARGDSIIFALVRYAAAGVCAGGVVLMVFSMLADTMEYDHLRTGLRREGVFAGLVTLIEKGSSALGVAITGGLLGAAGYVASRAGAAATQSPAALAAIRIAFALVPAATALGCAAIIARYDLARGRLEDLRRAGPPPLGLQGDSV